MPASASPHALLRLRTPHVSLPEVTKTASPQEPLRGSHPPFGKPPGDLESKWVIRNWFRPAQIASPAPPPSSEIQKVSERRPSGHYNTMKLKALSEIGFVWHKMPCAIDRKSTRLNSSH